MAEPKRNRPGVDGAAPRSSRVADTTECIGPVSHDHPSGVCVDCGAPGPPRRVRRAAKADVCVHDCDAGEWQLIRFTLPAVQP